MADESVIDLLALQSELDGYAAMPDTSEICMPVDAWRAISTALAAATQNSGAPEPIHTEAGQR